MEKPCDEGLRYHPLRRTPLPSVTRRTGRFQMPGSHALSTFSPAGAVERIRVHDVVGTLPTMAERRRPNMGVILLLAPLLWGATFPATKVGVEAIGVFPFMFWTRLLGFVTILAAVPLVARREVTRPA